MFIIFDFDGTIVDASERMYKLFCTIAPGFNYTKEVYWKKKREGISHKAIFDRYARSDFEKFETEWMEKIETLEYLQYDVLYPGIMECVKGLVEFNTLFLLTARQYKRQLLLEIDRLGLSGIFSNVFVTERKTTKEHMLKEIIDLNAVNEKKIIYISDMGKDILLGKKLGIKTIAVTYGFMNEKKVLEYKPDFVVKDTESLLQLILNLQE